MSDGDPSGDGDGDPSGDGDGDPSGDGDGDGDACPMPLEPSSLEFDPATVPLSEFFDEPAATSLFADDGSYTAFFGEDPPVALGDQWLAFVHHARRPMGTHYAITGLLAEDDCALRYPTPGELIIERVPSGFSGDESVNGTWTLSITDTSAEGGTLVGWGLEIMSRYD